ncbi:MAG: hypothetical protein ABSB75_00310 [Candidatus Limnocylindrales bacterium]
MATAVPPRSPRAAAQSPGQAATSKRAPTAIAIETGGPTAARPADLNRIGVVFVHGIGTQPACETFLDWSGSVVRVLGDWLKEHGFDRDPVRRCDYDLSGARLPILELDVPAWDGHVAQTWVLTEAWWAATTRSPGLGSMTTYVRHGLRPIMAGIRQSYDARAASWTKERNDARAYARKSPDSYLPGPLVLGAMGGRIDWVNVLDRIQKELTILAFGPALVIGSIVLWAYAPFRAIPIQPIKNMAALKSADNFLTRWFGELPDITRDPIQSANVRSRLVAAIRGLRAEGCGRIVVVAHSGGAIVSFTTLCDPAFMDVKVDKLITLGEGLALAWRIEGATKGLQPGSRLLGNLSELRPDLRWVDFWSTYDPAPAGHLQPPPGVSLSNNSHSTINRMSIIEDHGSYWDNDEEFLIPLLQNIDVPNGRRTESRFFHDTYLGTVRLAWRRRRVAVLALWRWIAALGAAIPILATTITAALGWAGVRQFAGLHSPARLGADFAHVWASIPGHEIIAGPLDGLSQVASWPGALPVIGEWVMGSVIIAVCFLILARIGVGRWEVWDAVERHDARSSAPVKPTGWWPTITFLALSAVALEMMLLAFAWLWR